MVHAAVQRVLRPGSFFVAPPGKLRIEHVAEESVPWEIFRGHLLEAAHARASERFRSWHVFLDLGEAPAAAPLLSIRWQREQNKVFVTRQILCHGFEAYEDAPGVILSRPVEKWVAELVATSEPESLGGDWACELGRLLFLAVVGTSRLPITSLETPLPAFSLGQLAYLPEPSKRSDPQRPWSDPVEFLADAIGADRPLEEQAKALETALRAVAGPIAPLVGMLEESLAGQEGGALRLVAQFRAVFNGVALSPYTHFADTMIGLIVELADTAWFGPAHALDLVGHMLRNLCRHLTAFDLVLFHNFGANYPDALFLDALLGAYFKLLARHPDWMRDAGRAGRLRRRALRAACLVRRHYEGHLVPDAPTSMGENVRVLSEPFARVPEEQILETGKRRRRLFEKPTDEALGELGHRVLGQSLAELDQPRELRELGMAQFLDRPLGVVKQPGEVDRTPLLSYEAFSRSIARRRIRELSRAGWIDEERRDVLTAAIDHLSVTGAPVADLSPIDRPGVVSIADAGKAAADFILLRTMRGSLDELLSHYDWQPLVEVSPGAHDFLLADRDVLFVQHGSADDTRRPVVRVYGRSWLRLEFGLPDAAGSTVLYEERSGVELPRLRILKICDSTGQRDLADRPIWLNRHRDDD